MANAAIPSPSCLGPIPTTSWQSQRSTGYCRRRRSRILLMPFERAFGLSAVVLAAAAFTGLVFARSIPSWLAVVTTMITLFAFLRVMGWHIRLKLTEGLSASPTFLNGLLIGAFLLFLFDLTLYSRELLPAGVHFLVILLGIKLLTFHERRDYRQLYAICLMAILASAATTERCGSFPFLSCIFWPLSGHCCSII